MIRDKPNKKQLCLDNLVQRILTLDIEPGSVLDEVALSDMYELSRTPLREVFQKLAGKGYLTLQENRGAKVSSMDISSMRNFFQTAPMIYAAIARLAAENGTSGKIEKLKTIQQAFRRNAGSGEAADMAIHNHRFHRLIGEMASNPFLAPSLDRLLIDHTRMSQTFYRPNNARERERIWLACDQHDKMIEAFERRDPASAVQLTLDHWALSRNEIEKFAKPDPLPMDLDIGEQDMGKPVESAKHAV